MIPWNQRTHFAGLDWACDHHDLAVLNAAGQVVLTLRFDHTADGWRLLREKIAPFAPLAVAIETSHGLAVEQLLAAGCEVYPIQPKSAVSYRER